ncbi:hypothetical protein [Vibrio viridaestus]|uniref:CMD domain protein n=1 Tax=Vibrio viridaestus TaxID=2487322 RepID=A0A3N9TIG2_9VIBR|nr:hypothetical protein [Vibrio viridaestus]RQW63704.1 hypothetical protein EES38_10720 [Vibrio viridaestus]
MTDSYDPVNVTQEGTSVSETLTKLRPEYAHGAIACREAVLRPSDELELSQELRSAIARRMAMTAAHPEALLVDFPMPSDDSLKAFAQGDALDDSTLSTLAAHVDMIASYPSKASEQHLIDLQEAGFSVAQIIAISELCAYVCFQIRLSHGLSLLEASA